MKWSNNTIGFNYYKSLKKRKEARKNRFGEKGSTHFFAFFTALFVNRVYLFKYHLKMNTIYYFNRYNAEHAHNKSEKYWIKQWLIHKISIIKFKKLFFQKKVSFDIMMATP